MTNKRKIEEYKIISIKPSLHSTNETVSGSVVAYSPESRAPKSANCKPYLLTTRAEK